MNIDDLPTDLRRRVIHYDPTGCWIWTGAVTRGVWLNAARACLKSGLEPIGDDQAGDEVGRWKWRGKAA